MNIFLRPMHLGEAKAVWRRSTFMQSEDAPEAEGVLINVEEPSVGFVPDEGPGHVSKRAYRRFAGGLTMGRRASLALRTSTVTGVAAFMDKPDLQRGLPQVVLVGEPRLWRR